MIDIKFQRDSSNAVALDGDKEVGKISFIEDGKTWVIESTRVEETYGGQGIARKLVNKVIAEAVKANVKLEATCSYAAKVLNEL